MVLNPCSEPVASLLHLQEGQLLCLVLLAFSPLVEGFAWNKVSTCVAIHWEVGRGSKDSLVFTVHEAHFVRFLCYQEIPESWSWAPI